MFMSACLPDILILKESFASVRAWQQLNLLASINLWLYIPCKVLRQSYVRWLPSI